jgi:hypothetical protein
MQRLNSVTPVAVRTPIDARYTAVSDTRTGVDPVVRVASNEDGVLETEKRRRDRRIAVLLMVLSGVFVIACIGGVWLALNGR